MAEGINHTDFELLYLLAGLFVLLNAAISWLVFAQCSMRPLERKLRELKSDNISEWDGPGWRVATYAIKLVLPASIWGEHAMFIDPFLLKQLSTRRDRILAAWMMGSWLTFIVFSVLYIELL